MQLSNMLAMGLRTTANVAFGLRRPINVMLAVTNRCNSQCRYCKIPQRDPEDIPTDRLLRLIDEMRDAGAIRLGLWGGEPLLREDIGTLVSHAHRRGIYVTMDSNGFLWPERQADLADLDHLMISLDGDKTGHEANRGPGSFDLTMRALEMAAARPGLKVWILAVLTRHNLRDIDFILDTARRLGIHAAFQVLHHNDILGRNHDRMMASTEEYRESIRLLLRRKKEGAPISSSSRYLKYLLQWPDYRMHSSVEPRLGLRCKAGELYCNVDADGRVYACSLMVGQAAAANALEVGFARAFRSIPPLPCQGCMAACFTEYNYLYRLDPICIAEWLKTTRS
jgi:mycofactocin biosynthetic radical S-adenosylmethionine protein MftC